MVSLELSKRNPKVEFPSRQGVLGKMYDGRSEDMAEQIRQNGYLMLPQIVPDEMCDRLMAFAESTPAAVRLMDFESKQTVQKRALFDANNPIGVRYDYFTSDLVDNSDVQALMADSSLLELAQQYLGCQPVADVLSMWWHTSFSKEPDAEAAQFFHFDMDRIKWLKIFIYLTDVNLDNGPHSFVKGSHRTCGIPADLLRRGYVRLTDEEVVSRYKTEDVVSFTAPRGSMIIEDTRGLHKGVHVIGAPRLILQLQFSNSLFGASYSKAPMKKIIAPEMKIMLERSPSIYRQFLKN
jgi:hypothetical protein